MKTDSAIQSRRGLIIDAIDGLVADLLYYDRRDDEELPRGAIQEAIASGEITIAEMVTKFASALEEDAK